MTRTSVAACRCNPLLPPLISRRIAADLSREFANQAAAERAAGMPVTVMLAADEVAKAKLEVCACFVGGLVLLRCCLLTPRMQQIGFIDFCVRPLYALLQSPGLAPGLGTRCLALIQANRTAWNGVISEALATRSSQPRQRATPLLAHT
jgi:hypothetical protein